MAVISCALESITNDSCRDRGGVKSVYLAKYSEIDFAAMVGDALVFDPATHEILGWTMVGAGVFRKWEFDKETAFYSAVYTDETQSYTNLVTMIFEGKDAAKRLKLVKAVECCKMVVIVVQNNGTKRIFGVEYDGGTFDVSLKQLHVARHADESGQLGQGKARDEVDLGAKSFYAPLFGDFAETDIPGFS